MITTDHIIRRKYVVSLNKAYKELIVLGIPDTYKLLLRNLIFNDIFRDKIFDLELENIKVNIKWLENQARKEYPRISKALRIIELNIKRNKLVLTKQDTKRLYLDHICNI